MERLDPERGRIAAPALLTRPPGSESGAPWLVSSYLGGPFAPQSAMSERVALVEWCRTRCPSISAPLVSSEASPGQ